LFLLICSAFSVKAQEKTESEEIIPICGTCTEATFPGGNTAFQNYLVEHLDYNCIETSEEQALSGRIYFRFIVNADGSIEDVQVLRGISEQTDACLKTFIEEMPHWVPAKDSEGNSFRSQVQLPLSINLQ